MKDKPENPQEIKCCPNCDNPVIWTFLFSGSEYFCWECKWDGGMFDAESKNFTANKQKKYNADKKAFDKASEHYVANGCTLGSCEQCQTTGEDHIMHWTEEDQANHLKAKELIFKK